MMKYHILSMPLVPESTKSYSIFLEIATNTFSKSLERQGPVNSVWLKADTGIWLLLFSNCNLKFWEIPWKSFTPVVQELQNTFVYH